MEDPFDFLLDFNSITDNTDTPMPETPKNKPPQEIPYYIQITQGGKRAYQCTDVHCGKIFRYNSEAKRHAVIHQNDRPYSCNFMGCTKTFKRPETLEDHMRVHEGSLPFLCDNPGCDRRFASTSALRYHKLLHKDNRKFKCDLEGCGKSFLTQATLKQHQRVHSSDSLILDIPESKPFKVVKSELKRDTSDSDAKLSETICWELKSQKNKDASLEDKMQEHYDLVRNILAENERLKERLKEHEKEKSKTSSEKEAQFHLQRSDSVFSSGAAEFRSLIDTDLLEFLKDNDPKNFLDFE